MPLPTPAPGEANDEEGPTSMSTKSWDVEIAQAGRWNSSTAGWVEITKDDLASIAAAFSSLREKVKPMLKLGHNNKQPLINADDGQPALGWVSQLKLAGDKLVATFTDVPEILQKAIKGGRYKRVSVELDRNVKVAGDTYPWVLSAVGLLGADIPAIDTLADLATYMSQDGLDADAHLVFTDFKPKEAIMADNSDALQVALTEAAELKATVTKLTADLEAEKTARAEMEQKIETEKAEAAFTASKDKFTAKCEELVKAKAITPAQREQYVAKFSKDSADTLNDALEVVALSVPAASHEHGKGQQSQTNDTPITDPAAEVTKLSRERAARDKLDFTTASRLVLQENPELAVAYRDANDK